MRDYMLLGYARVSTQEQAADGTTSLQQQQEIIRGYAMMKRVPAYDTVIFTDAGVSGSLRLHARPAGGEMLGAAKKGDYLIAAKLDRMFRNSFDAISTYEICREKGIELVLLDLGTDPVTKEGTMSKVIYTVMAAFADFDRGRIRERMLDGKEAKRRNGGHIGGEAPFGFRIEGKGRASRLVEDEREQRIIDAIRTECAEDPTLTSWKLAPRLNTRGFTTRTGRPFQTTQVQRILDRVYAHSPVN